MIHSLKEAILEKHKVSVSSTKDCALLASEIQKTTGRNISETTIRRLFGILKSKSKLSQYNLDTLALYCGYSDYVEFQKSLPKNKVKTNLAIELEKLTKHTLTSIHKKSLTPFHQTIGRIDVEHSLEAFSASGEPVFALVAPGGYGKSTALAHWVKKQHKNNVLFIKASLLLRYVLDSYQTQALALTLDNEQNVFTQWMQDNPNQQFIIVIDALEELGIDNGKLEKLFSYIVNAVSSYGQKMPLKIIIGLQVATWEQVTKIKFDKGEKNIVFPISNIVRHNLSAFSNEEISTYINNYNKVAEHPIVFEYILGDLLELLRTPINTFLYTRLHALGSKYDEHLSIGYSQLLKLYLKEYVFESKYAEEKEDILWAIISHFNSSENTSINKKDLKLQFPIHVKREVNYYNAYSDLLLCGILKEERLENKYGLYTTAIQFKHENYFYYLTALNFIKGNNGLSNVIFNTILTLDKELTWKAQVISIIYEIAYDTEDFETIENFCDLPVEIHESFQVRFKVGNSFRKNNSITDKVIHQFAKSETGRIYYFEEFVDTNYLHNYTHRIHAYLKNKTTNEAILFGNSILFLDSFLKLHKQKCSYYKSIIDSIEIDSSIHPWPIGRKVASNLFFNGFIENPKLEDSIKTVRSYQKIAYKYKKGDTHGLVTFELPVIVPLILLGEFEILEELLLYAIEYKNSDISNDEFFSFLSEKQNTFPELVLEYAKYKQSKNCMPNFNKKIEAILINQSNGYDDFIYQIVLRWILFDFYSHNGEKNRAQDHLSSALQLSQFAGYDFLTMYLEINNPKKSAPEQKILLSQIESYGFIPASFLRFK